VITGATVENHIARDEEGSKLISHIRGAGPAFRKSVCWFRVGAAGATLIVRLAIAGVALVLPLHSALAQFIEQGPKLIGSAISGMPGQGFSVALSADGNTAIVGGPSDGSTGAAWVFTRSGGVWSQQGMKLVGAGAVGNAQQGRSVALSADGNTAIVGGPADNSNTGAAWIFTRSGGIWAQQGDKLVGTGASVGPTQGASIALSGDGDTAIVGGPLDTAGNGAVWVYTRSAGIWSQQGAKLTGDAGARLGASVALSADGNIALAGEPHYNSDAGTVVVFGRSGGVWTVQNGLVGTGATGIAEQGWSVALSADGRTAIVGGPTDASNAGAAWVFIRTGANSWFQQGVKLVGTGTIGGGGEQGFSVALSADGNTAIVGGPADNGFLGAAWAFTRSGTAWTQLGAKLVGGGNSGGAGEGTSVALSGDGQTGIVGGPDDNSNVGAAWVFARSRVATHDFNGDHLSDIAWRDTSGNLAIWEMNGTSILNQATSFVGNVPGNWSIVGNGDYNGDGKSDIAWHDTTGNVAIWEMNGTAVLNQATSFVGNVPGTWAIVGTGDFNGDGNSDIVWRDGSGNVAIWEMNGTTILNQSTSFIGNVAGNWSIVGNGDYNGDGKSDILWHDTSGNVAIWEMNGTTVLNQATSFVGNVPGTWAIVATGDFNGDGKSDIVWHDGSGNVAIWEMNGTTILNQATSFVGNVPGTWSIAGSGDYNGDGMSDIVWHDGSGNVAIWEMNGTAVLNQATSFVGNVAGNWSIQDPQGN
jgi:predicted small secreted protein